jgi:hypothetical protein
MAEYQTRLIASARQIASPVKFLCCTSSARSQLAANNKQNPGSYAPTVYGWFTERIDTRDLKEAKTLLEELGAQR